MLIKRLKGLYFRFAPYWFSEIVSLYKNQEIFLKRKVIFIHVPKAAGTSISKSIYGRSVTHVSAKKFRHFFPKNFDECFTFSIVRNPYERLYSAYNFVRSQGTKELPIHTKSIYQSEICSTFERFVLEYLPFSDLRKEDYVFQPQYWFTHDDKLIQLVDKVWKLEQIDQFVEYFKIVDSEYELPHVNKTKKPKDLKAVYSKEMKAVVDSIYKEDFELFGYHKVLV